MPSERSSVGQASARPPCDIRAALMRVLDRPCRFGRAITLAHPLPSKRVSLYSQYPFCLGGPCPAGTTDLRVLATTHTDPRPSENKCGWYVLPPVNAELRAASGSFHCAPTRHLICACRTPPSGTPAWPLRIL